jgi:hypothetical protein
VYASRTLEGRTELAGSLAPDLGALVRTALRAATTPDGAEDPARTPAQARADALADVCKFFLDHHDHPNPTPKNRLLCVKGLRPLTHNPAPARPSESTGGSRPPDAGP